MSKSCTKDRYSSARKTDFSAVTKYLCLDTFQLFRHFLFNRGTTVTAVTPHHTLHLALSLQRSCGLLAERPSAHRLRLQEGCVRAVQRCHLQDSSGQTGVAGLPGAAAAGRARRHGAHPPEERGVQAVQHSPSRAELQQEQRG